MTRAVLSIGSNIGDRIAQLRSVVAGLGERVVAVSPVYATDPWGGVDQDDFLNAVVVADDPDYDCRDWLRHGQELEQAAGRERLVRWGARTLDVDVIWCAHDRGSGLVACNSEELVLTLPHPHAHERAFVLIPWLDVFPEATIDIDGVPRQVRDVLAGIDEGERAGVRPTSLALAPEHGEGAEPCS